MKTKIKHIVIISLMCLSAFSARAQQNNGTVSMYDVKIDGDSYVITTPQGDVTFNKVYNSIKNEYQWTFSVQERQKWTSEIVEGIRGTLLAFMNEHENNIHSDIQQLSLKLDSLREEDLEERKILEIAYQEKEDSLTRLINDKDLIIESLSNENRILIQDKAEWAYSFIPGVRQFRLGYKKSAYFYWGAYGAALVSLGMGLKYESDYHRYIRDINGQNQPSTQLYDDMDRAKRNRDGWYTASVGIAVGTYVINLIDAFAISNRRKIVPETLDVAPVATPQGAGVTLSYKF